MSIWTKRRRSYMPPEILFKRIALQPRGRKTIALKASFYMTFAEKVVARRLSRVSKISGKPMS
ncbi:hypothetical protein EN826_032835, partial [Mesorhizobium sp. M1D.F.Ca.ET.183.01.1.1]|uniref:hypothetical protein n=1 Tax=Mesorhizobium sp. M1D.F.Ca.ET.183.01.1.1 TaxID=2496666 RepID=UPI0010940E3F